MKIIAIETSCDETGVAVLERKGKNITVLAEAVASQVDLHKETGGVVPNVAAREHAKALPPLLKKVMAEAKVTGSELDAIAVTVGPGLAPALAQGVNTARALAKQWQKPIVPVNHLAGHIYSALLTHNDDLTQWSSSAVKFPALALIVSGGHTLLIKITGHLEYNVLGSTLDDAAGEAFDKVARLLGLPYPGGPALSQLADQGDPAKFSFPRPMKNSGDLNFSFSGLKTAVLYTVRDLKGVRNSKDKVPDPLIFLTPSLAADIAASFQAAVVESLLIKVQRAVEQTPPKTLLLAGGVAANHSLRRAMQTLANEQNIPLRIAPLALCGDNALMIGLAGCFAVAAGRTTTWADIEPVARLKLC